MVGATVVVMVAEMVEAEMEAGVMVAVREEVKVAG